MTVCDLFTNEKILIDFVDRHFRGAYYVSCSKFIKEKWNEDIDTLTVKQKTWIYKILDDCVEKRIEDRVL